MGWLKRLDGAKRGACTILRGRKHFEPERGEIITDFVTSFSRIITLTVLSSHRALRATTRKKGGHPASARHRTTHALTTADANHATRRSHPHARISARQHRNAAKNRRHRDGWKSHAEEERREERGSRKSNVARRSECAQRARPMSRSGPRRAAQCRCGAASGANGATRGEHQRRGRRCKGGLPDREL